MPMRLIRRAARRRTRKVLDGYRIGVPVEEIAYRMNAKPRTVKKMLGAAGLNVPEQANNEKGAS